MKRFPALARVAPAGLFALLAACVVDLAFDMNQDFQVDEAPGATSINTVQSFDLGSVQAVQDHKGDVQSFSLQAIDVTVTALGTGNKAHTLTGSLALRPDGAPSDGSKDVKVGDVTNFSLAQGSSYHLAGNSTLDNFIFTTFKGSGKFSVVVAGSTDGEAHGTLHAVIHATLGYGAGL